MKDDDIFGIEDTQVNEGGERKVKKNIFETLMAVMNDIPAIGKDSKNMAQGFSFRGVDAVTNTLNPIFRKHNLIVMPTKITELSRDVKDTKNGGQQFFTNLIIEYTFYAEDGSYVKAEVKGEGADSGDKSSNKAMAVAFKYAVCQTFSIPTEKEEPEADDPQLKAPAPCCENCGKEFTDTVVNGKKYTAMQIKQIAEKKYDGIALCKECGTEYLNNK